MVSEERQRAGLKRVSVFASDHRLLVGRLRRKVGERQHRVLPRVERLVLAGLQNIVGDLPRILAAGIRRAGAFFHSVAKLDRVDDGAHGCGLGYVDGGCRHARAARCVVSLRSMGRVVDADKLCGPEAGEHTKSPSYFVRCSRRRWALYPSAIRTRPK